MTKEQHNVIQAIKSWNWGGLYNLTINNRNFTVKPIAHMPPNIRRVLEWDFEKLIMIGDFDINKIDWKLQALTKAGALNDEYVFSVLVSARIKGEKL